MKDHSDPNVQCNGQASAVAITWLRWKRRGNTCWIVLLSAVLLIMLSATVVGLTASQTDFPASLGNFPRTISMAADPNDTDPFTFLVMGDVKRGMATFEELLEIMEADRPDFAVILGDFVPHPHDISHQVFALDAGEYGDTFPMFVVPGNHDISEYPGDGPFTMEDFEHTYGASQFHFVKGPYLFIFLNNIPIFNRNSSYLDYLEDVLSKAPGTIKNTIVFMHIPPVEPVDNHAVTDARFMEIVGKYGVDYVFCGHHHAYVKVKRGPTTIIISGGGGDRLRGMHGGFHHSVRVMCDDGDISETVICVKRYTETFEQIEYNLAYYIWPLISGTPLSMGLSFAIVATSVVLLTLLIRQNSELRRRPIASSNLKRRGCTDEEKVGHA